MVYRVKSDMSETDIGMPVFCGSRNIFTVINVKDGNLIFSDQAVELIDHIIEMVDDIISAVTGMAGVKADSQLVIVYNAVINLCKLFKCAADFGTFSGHGFQCDMTGSICCQDSVESFDDLADSGVSSGSYMRTRMKYQSMAFAGGSALNLLCQEFDCKFKCFRFYRISQIDDIGSMYDDFVNAMFFHIFPGR